MEGLSRQGSASSSWPVVPCLTFPLVITQIRSIHIHIVRSRVSSTLAAATAPRRARLPPVTGDGGDCLTLLRGRQPTWNALCYNISWNFDEDHVRHVSSPRKEYEVDHVSHLRPPRAHTCRAHSLGEQDGAPREPPRPQKEKEAVHVRHVSSSGESRGATAPARPPRGSRCQIRVKFEGWCTWKTATNKAPQARGSCRSYTCAACLWLVSGVDGRHVARLAHVA